MSMLTKVFGGAMKQTPMGKMLSKSSLSSSSGGRASSFVTPIDQPGAAGNQGAATGGELGAPKKKKKRGSSLISQPNTGDNAGASARGDELG